MIRTILTAPAFIVTATVVRDIRPIFVWIATFDFAKGVTVGAFAAVDDARVEAEHVGQLQGFISGETGST